jgi:hypothetical protein
LPKRNPPITFLVTTGHSRSKNGVASLAYDPVVHCEPQRSMDGRDKPGHDDDGVVICPSS